MFVNSYFYSGIFLSNSIFDYSAGEGEYATIFITMIIFSKTGHVKVTFSYVKQ